jgi:hypothetical protein
MFLTAMISVCAMLCTPAHSATVTWVLPGVVTSVSGSATAAPFAVSVGDPFELALVLDLSVTDANADAHQGSFDQAMLSGSFSTSAGSIVWPIEHNAELSIRNDLFRSAENRTVDEVAIAGQTLGEVGAPVIGASALLQNAAPGATSLGPLTSDALPLQPNPRDWTTRSFFFSYQPAGAGASFELTGELGQVAPSNVPLPASLWLLASAALLWVAVSAARRGARDSSAPAGSTPRCASTSAV